MCILDHFYLGSESDVRLTVTAFYLFVILSDSHTVMGLQVENQKYQDDLNVYINGVYNKCV